MNQDFSLSIVEKEKLDESDKTSKYLRKAPEVVIEVDTKAEAEESTDSMSYVHEKTDQLLDFGV